jgi:hypothetical protein
MNKSVLLDTSFVISLVDDSRENHQKAVQFYKYFIENKIAMILSSIVTSEFCTKQDITDLPLNNFKPLPFNIPDSYHISSLFDDIYKNRDGQNRACVKDDYKILSQCVFNKIDYFITEDFNLHKKVLNLKSSKKLHLTSLHLPDGYEVAFNIPPTLFP